MAGITTLQARAWREGNSMGKSITCIEYISVVEVLSQY